MGSDTTPPRGSSTGKGNTPNSDTASVDSETDPHAIALNLIVRNTAEIAARLSRINDFMDKLRLPSWLLKP